MANERVRMRRMGGTSMIRAAIFCIMGKGPSTTSTSMRALCVLFVVRHHGGTAKMSFSGGDGG